MDLEYVCQEWFMQIERGGRAEHGEVDTWSVILSTLRYITGLLPMRWPCARDNLPIMYEAIANACQNVYVCRTKPADVPISWHVICIRGNLLPISTSSSGAHSKACFFNTMQRCSRRSEALLWSPACLKKRVDYELSNLGETHRIQPQ